MNSILSAQNTYNDQIDSVRASNEEMQKDIQDIKPNIRLSVPMSLISGSFAGFGIKKVIFQNFELSLSCSGFSRQLKICSKLDQKTRLIIAGKSIENTS